MEKARTLMAIPLAVSGDNLGGLVFGWRSDVQPSPAQSELAETFASYASTIILNKRTQDEREEALGLLLKVNTELRDQYEEVDHAHSELGAVLDSVSEAIVLVGPDATFLTVNKRAVELFGIAAEEVLGRKFSEVMPLIERIFADPVGFAQRVRKTAGDASSEFSDVLLQVWPERRELQLFSTPVTMSGGRHLGRLYVYRDITRERELDRMKSEFVAMVSHELRTPMTSIKGYVDLLLDGEVGELQPEQTEFLSIVRNNADRLVSLINDLLDISRIEAGRIELRRSSVDVAALIETVATSFRPQMEAHLQRLELHVPPDLPPVAGDQDRIAQILTNLLSNAHKYTPRSGGISISAGLEGDQVRVQVCDSGIGMSADEQAQLFTKFFRADHQTVQEAPGTGLGLAITRSLVEAHGGAICVDSAPGRGSTFTFTLPISYLPLEEHAEASGTGAGGLVLVVDDEPEVAGLVRRYLERAGYEVAEAHTGAEALRLARERQPRLITLDVILPGGDGFTVLEWLKNDPATAAIPVVMLSILPDVGRGKLLGAVDYLNKPVKDRVLLDHIRRILGRHDPKHVLLADGDAGSRALLGQLLERAGYRVSQAAASPEVLELAARERPSLILMDAHLPGLPTAAALRQLRANPASADIPVVLMTPAGNEPETTQALLTELGVPALTKPHTAEELAETLSAGMKKAAARR